MWIAPDQPKGLESVQDGDHPGARPLERAGEGCLTRIAGAVPLVRMERQQAEDSEFIGSDFGMCCPVGTHNPPAPLRFGHGVYSLVQVGPDTRQSESVSAERRFSLA